jgi:hypothetical protein
MSKYNLAQKEAGKSAAGIAFFNKFLLYICQSLVYICLI